MDGYDDWQEISENVLNDNCSAEDDDNPPFNYGIYTRAISSQIVESKRFFSKFCFCLWWGLQNLRYSFLYILFISFIVISSKFVECLNHFFLSFTLCSTLGQGLETSTYPLEILFSIGIGVAGLILFALLIGNIQVSAQYLNYEQSFACLMI